MNPDMNNLRLTHDFISRFVDSRNPSVPEIIEVFTIMFEHIRAKNSEMKKSDRGSKFNGSLIVIGIVLTMLFLITNAAGANSTDPTVSDFTVVNTQIVNLSQVPASQPPDIVTALATQTQNVIAALTAQPTVTSAVSEKPNEAIAITTADITDISTAFTKSGTVPLIRTGTAASGQFTLRAGKRVSQAEKEAAAADYKKTREAFLLQASQGNQVPGRVSNAAPTLDPGGVPHYFGPYANWANSPMPMGSIINITVDNGGTGYAAPVVSIEDVYFTGSGATATAAVAGGIITNITITNPGINYTAPVVIISDPAGINAAATASIGGPFRSGIRKFVDSLPGLNTANANNLGQYIPIAIANTTAFQGTDYYEIELGEFTGRMHSDLPNTTFRGYRQTNTADPTVSQFHYLGPLIIATRDRPVRVKFTNNLSAGAGGNLFIPVDTTVMGAGMGPLGMNITPVNYTQNRATLHLHGGATPWISDGTPYQWITPANEYTSYPEGVSVYDVPDMPNPGNGSQTFFYTNQQSARLMFYHDHAHGITRLNVYAGEAAGYLVTDDAEQFMINGTASPINPAGGSVLPDVGIPLIIQDKTWVDANTIAAQDPTWNSGTNPGAPNTGDLWYPHVYMPAQDPFVDTGVNAYGRWHYGPWFFPPTDVQFGPVANPYYPTEPELQIPGTPNPSAVGEAFMDTPIVNGAAYPNMTVEPRAYRFRILSAADDRFFNLQLYVADANVTTADGRNNTEVRMVPAVTTPGFPADWPTDNREGGVPDPATRGPSFIQIGTEGGFLPAPVVVPNQPITYVNDPTRFDFGNADKHALLLAAAERADVIVDFSQYAGKTLILYNDAPAAFPAGVAVYDYYTGAPDRTANGGSPGTQPGYGPNTRTIMQIKVNNTAPALAYDVVKLNAVFANTTGKRGVFESTQPPIIIPQIAYNSAYNANITVNNFARIADHFKNFTALSGVQFNITFQPKALHDEMGAVYDEYGRMSGMLGLEVPSRTSVTSQFMPFGYASPPTDVLMTSLGEMAGPQPGDGTQIWRLSHNGVDTHPIHWHMYNVQIINRVGWDGFIRAPDPAELGWKDTLRVSPLEDTIVALRPVAVTVPFAVPDQIRSIDPTMPLGGVLKGPPAGGWFDPQGNPVGMNGGTDILNHLVNFGWEYVWHCHILAHEEMDMMHSQAVSVNDPGTAPDTLRSGEVYNATTNTTAVFLVWNDRSTQETDWLIQRSNISQNNWTDFKTVPSYSKAQTGGTAMAIDGSIPAGTTPNYSYRVMAANVVGDDFVYDAPSAGFDRIMRNSTVSNVNISQTVALPGAVTFTSTPSTGDAPLNVTFSGTSAGATGWSWDFGDGNFAGDNGMQNPHHVFEIPGTYTVTLTAMTTRGNATSGTQTIIVTKASPPATPTASFTATPINGTAPLTVAFDASTSSSIPSVWATWRWSFGDGTFSSLQNPNHTYTTGGNFTVSLIATNLGGTSAPAFGSINVTTAPIAASEIGVFRPSTHAFYLDANGNGIWNGTVIDKAYGFGISTDIPVSGDWNHDGITEIGVFRPSTHSFYLDANGNGIWNGTVIDKAYGFGISTDLPVSGDWNHDGTTDIGVFRPSTHAFYLDANGNGIWDGTVVDKAYTFGMSTDLPVSGDWNHDGTTEIGVFRPSTHSFYLDANGNGIWDGTVIDKAYNFGITEDKPVSGKWS
jgi:PKD repeat protein/FtsP/CotA-like multicopper oxidase with cupredoxin domain